MIKSKKLQFRTLLKPSNTKGLARVNNKIDHKPSYPDAWNRLKEEVTSHAVIGFGRMNPPHIGHAKLVKAVVAHAKKVGGTPYVFLSAKEGDRRNPLSYDYKWNLAREAFGKPITYLEQGRTPVDAAKQLEGLHKHITFVAGDDRQEGYKRVVDYVKKHHKFDSVNLVSSGPRKGIGAAGMSSSQMRHYALTNETDKFREGLPLKIRHKSDEIMTKVKSGLNHIHEDKTTAQFHEGIADSWYMNTNSPFHKEKASIINGKMYTRHDFPEVMKEPYVHHGHIHQAYKEQHKISDREPINARDGYITHDNKFHDYSDVCKRADEYVQKHGNPSRNEKINLFHSDPHSLVARFHEENIFEAEMLKRTNPVPDMVTTLVANGYKHKQSQGIIHNFVNHATGHQVNVSRRGWNYVHNTKRGPRRRSGLGYSSLATQMHKDMLSAPRFSMEGLKQIVKERRLNIKRQSREDMKKVFKEGASDIENPASKHYKNFGIKVSGHVFPAQKGESSHYDILKRRFPSNWEHKINTYEPTGMPGEVIHGYIHHNGEFHDYMKARKHLIDKKVSKNEKEAGGHLTMVKWFGEEVCDFCWMETNGAGFDGTDHLAGAYAADTPGQIKKKKIKKYYEDPYIRPKRKITEEYEVDDSWMDRNDSPFHKDKAIKDENGKIYVASAGLKKKLGFAIHHEHIRKEHPHLTAKNSEDGYIDHDNKYHSWMDYAGKVNAYIRMHGLPDKNEKIRIGRVDPHSLVARFHEEISVLPNREKWLGKFEDGSAYYDYDIHHNNSKIGSIHMFHEPKKKKLSIGYMEINPEHRGKFLLHHAVKALRKEFPDVRHVEAERVTGGGPTKKAQGDRAWNLPEEVKLPSHVAQSFRDMGYQQRDEPEAAMLKVQHVHGGGVLNGVVEHVGDLTHRMSHLAKYKNAGGGMVREKTEKTLRWLKNPYGFEREHHENMRNNAEYYGKSYEEHKAGVDSALKNYAEAHSKLPVYNRAQWLGREAAVAVGHQNWPKAIGHLEELHTMANSKHWDRHAFSHRLDEKGNLKHYTPSMNEETPTNYQWTSEIQGSTMGAAPNKSTEGYMAKLPTQKIVIKKKLKASLYPVKVHENYKEMFEEMIKNHVSEDIFIGQATSVQQRSSEAPNPQRIVPRNGLKVRVKKAKSPIELNPHVTTVKEDQWEPGANAPVSTVPTEDSGNPNPKAPRIGGKKKLSTNKIILNPTYKFQTEELTPKLISSLGQLHDQVYAHPSRRSWATIPDDAAWSHKSQEHYLSKLSELHKAVGKEVEPHKNCTYAGKPIGNQYKVATTRLEQAKKLHQTGASDRKTGDELHTQADFALTNLHDIIRHFESGNIHEGTIGYGGADPSNQFTGKPNSDEPPPQMPASKRKKKLSNSPVNLKPEINMAASLTPTSSSTQGIGET